MWPRSTKDSAEHDGLGLLGQKTSSGAAATLKVQEMVVCEGEGSDVV